MNHIDRFDDALEQFWLFVSIRRVNQSHHCYGLNDCVSSPVDTCLVISNNTLDNNLQPSGIQRHFRKPTNDFFLFLIFLVLCHSLSSPASLARSLSLSEANISFVSLYHGVLFGSYINPRYLAFIASDFSIGFEGSILFYFRRLNFVISRLRINSLTCRISKILVEIFLRKRGIVCI